MVTLAVYAETMRLYVLAKRARCSHELNEYAMMIMSRAAFSYQTEATVAETQDETARTADRYVRGL